MTTPPADPAAIGPFVVLRKLGEGAMGVVYAGFDKELDRKVALKLVRRELLNKGVVRERMTREAQAMARLSNPYVVQVYQVGEHDGGIYLAMEYVEGDTLTSWLKAQPRPWHVALRTICDAGRGLAAAHAAGLVHRDFKPDNVLVDSDGRPRVLDFGLVQAEGGPSDDELAVTHSGEPPTHATMPPTESVERSSLHWSVRLTQLGNVLGTPAYMSPEQHFGQPAGPYSDQFSFAIVLYEALYGIRPFNGDSWAAIRLQVQEGIVPPPSLESPVPRRLFRVIARGLAKAPEDRWPSMDAMLEALTHDPWKVRVRAAALAGAIGAASAASYGVAVSQSPGGERCETSGQLAGAWDDEREAAVSRAFAATHTPFSADAWKRVKSRLDAYAQTWTSEWKASCEAHASGAQTGRIADLRMACLSRRKSHLTALVDAFTTADAAVVENAIQAVAALPSIAECGDDDALLTPTPLPDDPQTAAQVEALREQLARVAAAEGTGKFERGLQLAAQVRAEASGIEYAPLSAEAALAEGRLLMNLGRATEADAALSRAVALGIASDLHAIAAEAAAIRVYVLGETMRHRDEGLVAASFAEPLVGRARDDGRLAALLLNNLGTLHSHADVERANTYYERSIEETRRRPGAVDPLLAITYNNLGNLFYGQERLDSAGNHYRQSFELFSTLLGDSHPLVAHPLAGLGDVSLHKGQVHEAIPTYVRALAMMEVSYGPDHPYLLGPLSGLGAAYASTGRPDEARRLLARAVEVAERHGQRGLELARALECLGDLAAVEADRGRARELYERAARVFDEAAGPDSHKGARAALRAGELAAELGDRAGAQAWFERVLSKKTGSKEHEPSRAGAALRLAAVLADRGADARACALVVESRAGLPEGDPRRAEADALAVRACPRE